MSEPRRHHYVPRVLLRRFTSNGKVLARVERSGAAGKATERSVCWAEDFYTLEGDGWEDSLGIEHHSDRAVEGPAGPAFRAVTEPGGFPPSDEHRQALARFVGWQFIRGPDARELLDTAPRFVTNVVMDPISRLLSRDRVLDVLRDVGFHVDATGELRRTPMLHLQGWIADTLAAGVRDMKLALVRFPSLALITSDRPVVQWGKIARGAPDFGVGLDVPHALSFHLDPRHALLFVPWEVCGDAWEERVVDGTPEHAERLNQRVAASAWERVFHHPGHAPLGGSPLPPRREFRDMLRDEVRLTIDAKPWPVRWVARRWLGR